MGFSTVKGTISLKKKRRPRALTISLHCQSVTACAPYAYGLHTHSPQSGVERDMGEIIKLHDQPRDWSEQNSKRCDMWSTKGCSNLVVFRLGNLTGGKARLKKREREREKKRAATSGQGYTDPSLPVGGY